jgi:hypothetical protein
MAHKFFSYLEQLINASEEHEVDLRQACMSAGLPSSTYYRWVQSKCSPNESSARTVFNEIKKMGM